MRTRALAHAALVVILIAAASTPATAGWRSHARDHGRDCEQDVEPEVDHHVREHRQRFDHHPEQPGHTGSRPYWGTMRPYWGPNEPPGVIHRGPRTNDLKK